MSNDGMPADSSHPSRDPDRAWSGEERRRLILDSALDAIVSIDAAGRILDWNKRAEFLFGWSAEEALGNPLSQLIIPHQHREAHDRGMRHFLRTGEGPILSRRIEITALRRNGAVFPIELTVAPARIGGEWMFSSFIRDLTEKKAGDDRAFLQSAAARILMRAESPEQALEVLLDTILERTPWEICAFRQTGGSIDGTGLSAMRFLPGSGFEPFSLASLSLPPGSGPGIAQALQAEGRPVWSRVSDWNADSPLKSPALAAGLLTYLAFPVHHGEILLGVFEFFASAEIGEDSALTDSLVSTGNQLGQFLERKRAEEDLKRREEQLNLIMDASPALISYIGSDRRYRFCNKAYENWFGHSRTEVIGRTMWEVLGETAYEKLKPMVDAVLAGKEQTFEYALPYKDGGTRYIRGHYLPHGWKEGRIEGFVVFIMDLSERRKFEETLLEKERFLESIFNGAEEAIFVVNVTEDGRFVFESFNPAYLRRTHAFGFDLGRMVGKSTREFADIFPQEAIEGIEKRYAECARSRTPMEYEEEVVLHGKRTHWLTRLAPIADETGRIFRLIGTATEITRQKEDAARIREAEDQLRQSQKMEAIGRLAGGIAHDFNNLLTAINGLSELAMLSIGDRGAVLEMLSDIKRSGERAAGLTGQLLAFSRKQILNPKLLDLNAVVGGMDSLLKRVIGEDIDLKTILAPELRPVRVDRSQLEQIILNLAINARDAMPDGGMLTLETSVVEIGEAAMGAYLEAKPGPHVELAVSDSGTGMSQEVKDRLFEPFFTTKEPGKGTGMGLATVYGIVKQSGGHIHVYSEPGRGTSFKIYFPAAGDGPPSQDKPETGKVPLIRGHGEAILLVEDEEVVRTYAHRVLAGLGYRVRMATHAKEALEMAAAEKQPIHLLLTDVVMPGMNGRELWESLRTGHPGMQVLYMSGYTDNAIVHHGVLDEDAPFLPKPFSPAQLAEKVRLALSGSQQGFNESEGNPPPGPQPPRPL